MSEGIFGTRADTIIDLVLVLQFLGVILLVYSIRAVRRGEVALHRSIQFSLAIIFVIAVVALEIDIHKAGGMDHFAAGGRYEGTLLFTVVLQTHLLIATVNALLWLIVPGVSWHRQRRGDLPGSFSLTHRRLGKAAALSFLGTVVSAGALYVIGFAL